MTMTTLETTTTVAVLRDPRAGVAPRDPRAVTTTTTTTTARVQRDPRAPRVATMTTTMIVNATVNETTTAIVNAAFPQRVQKERVVTPPTRSICYGDNCQGRKELM
jgi:hypothetical protein